MTKQKITSRAVTAMILMALEQGLDTTWPGQVGMFMTSDQASEEYAWLSNAPVLREWLGGRQAKGFTENSIEVKNKKFEATLAIMLDDLRRDKTGQLQIRINQLAQRVNTHWATLLTTLIDNNVKAYDGKNFFASDHKEGNSGTQRNLFTKTQIGELDVTTATRPTPKEAADALMAVIEKFYGLKDDQGEPLNEGAQGFLVMVPISFWAAFRQAVSSQFLSSGAGAVDNPLSAANDIGITVAPNPRLSWTTDFAVFRTDDLAKPFILQEEEAPVVSAIAEGSEEEFNNDRHLYGIKTMRNVGTAYWQYGIKATFG